jgi:hypothetical protein
LTKNISQLKLNVACKMDRQNWFHISSAALMISLLTLAGCIAAVPSPETTSPIPTDNIVSNEGAQTEGTSVTPPSTTTQPDKLSISSDPVSGQSGEVDLSWEQLCLSSEYQVQVAKDPAFTIIVLDTGSFAPAATQSPGAYYPAGGRAPSPSSVTGWGNLEAGHTYYWRARVVQAATGQHMLSPWSEVHSFTVEAGTSTSAVSYGVQAISPNNGTNAVPINSTSFNWTPLNDTTKYRFVLAKDAAMTEVVADAVVSTTAYSYQGQLEYSQSYFWKVMALEPAPSDWSATFAFHTEAAPPSAPVEAPAQTPVWAWLIIGVGLILLIATIVLTFTTRRR